MPLLTIPSGTPIMLGTPAKPMEESLQQDIGTMLLNVAGVLEAHAPQCYAIGVMEQPVQVLVVVLQAGAATEDIVDEILLGLAELLPEDVLLDIWPMDGAHSLLDSVRATGCRII